MLTSPHSQLIPPYSRAAKDGRISRISGQMQIEAIHMRIAVTGANGYVGTALCQHLLGKGADVIALTRNPHVSLPFSNPQLIERSVDYQNSHNLSQALTGADVVIHLIAKTHTQDCLSALEEYRAVNVGISRQVATAARQASVKRLVFLSSIKVNGESTTTQPFRHTDLPAPITAYGISKQEAEQMLSKECGDATELVILRPPLIYSVDAKGNIASLKRAIQKHWPLPLGRIHNKRSLIDLELLCEYLYQSCIIPEASGQTLLVSNSSPTSTAQLVQRIGKEIGIKPWLLPIPPAALRLVGTLTGKQEAIHKLCGNLEVDPSAAQQLLKPNRDC